MSHKKIHLLLTQLY